VSMEVDVTSPTSPADFAAAWRRRRRFGDGTNATTIGDRACIGACRERDDHHHEGWNDHSIGQAISGLAAIDHHYREGSAGFGGRSRRAPRVVSRRQSEGEGRGRVRRVLISEGGGQIVVDDRRTAAS
jgi:hypothetical protein